MCTDGFDFSQASTRLGTLVDLPWARARSWSKLVPERISPPEASGAPESKLPVCELWMLPFWASALYSPRMKSIRSRKSASGASTWPSSMSRPLPLRPPFLAVETVAREQHGQAHRRLARAADRLGLVAPDPERFHPR